MLAWIATAATFVCAVLLLFWGLALVLWRPLPALYNITKTLTFRWIVAISLLIMLLAFGYPWWLRQYGGMQ